MDNIKISYAELETKITELRTMRSGWDDYTSKTKPDLSGGGMTVTVADEIADAYATLYKAVCSLCDNTISFMENIKNSVLDVDQDAADAME